MISNVRNKIENNLAALSFSCHLKKHFPRFKTILKI